jgi:hypothetical protein
VDELLQEAETLLETDATVEELNSAHDRFEEILSEIGRAEQPDPPERLPD